MLKTMKNQMLPERGEGCRCKGKTPKTFMYVCMYELAVRRVGCQRSIAQWGNDAMPDTGVQHRSNLIVLSRQEQFHENFV